MLPPPPRSTLFPYTTLFRSQNGAKYVVIDADATTAIMNTDPARWGEDQPASPTPTHTGLPSAGGFNWKKSRSEEHTSELQSLRHLVCRLLLEKKKKKTIQTDGPLESRSGDKYRGRRTDSSSWGWSTRARFREDIGRNGLSVS